MAVRKSTPGGARPAERTFDAAMPAPVPEAPRLPLYWYWSESFGDRLSPWIVERISGQSTQHCWPSDVGPVPYLVTGSILTHAIRRGVVWGSGCAFETDLVGIGPPSDVFRILATRGPLSAAAVAHAGHTPHAHLDPGFLLPKLLPAPAVAPTAKVGILCSSVDYADVVAAYGQAMPVLNASCSVETVVSTICGWEAVVSSCLHGLVAAIAYGKPTLWGRFSNRMLGDGFKFRDMFASVGVDVPVLNMESVLSSSQISSRATTYDPPQTDALMQCCPFLPGREI